jgi:hypothetical protein
MPYKEDYLPKPQKASANHMSPTELEYCKAEITELLQRKLIESSRSPWACPAFYVNKHSEQKRGKPRMVINYKALNEALLPIRYPLPSKDLLFSKIGKCNIFSKFDLKEWILANRNCTRRQIQNRFCSPSRPISMASHAIWFKECAIRISEAHG